jgi:hypothetical protein
VIIVSRDFNAKEQCHKLICSLSEAEANGKSGNEHSPILYSMAANQPKIQHFKSQAFLIEKLFLLIT